MAKKKLDIEDFRADQTATKKPAKRRGKFWLSLFAIVAVVALVATTVGWFVMRAEGKKITAYFAAAVGVYADSDVRVLGVRVGTVDTVEPHGATVKVGMTLDPGVNIPENAKALVVTPSIVSDRYVQLTPVYTTGPIMDDGAIVSVENTAVPVELDELFSSLDKLTKALGPEGANKDGALSDFIKGGSQFLDGNGKELNELIQSLGQSTRTLSGSQDDLFNGLDNIQKFTSMLAANDQLVGVFNNQLSQVSTFLAEQHDEFGSALHELAAALSTVETFIKDNRSRLQTSVDKLQGTAQLLADQRAALAEALDTAPLALTNLYQAYDPSTGTLDGRGNLTEFLLGGGR